MRVCNARYVSALVIAITACSAKVFSSSTWLSEKPPAPDDRSMPIAPIGTPSRSSGTATIDRTVPEVCAVTSRYPDRRDIADMDDPPRPEWRGQALSSRAIGGIGKVAA